MSTLVGVREQTREGEGAALREGIIQQPGPFYNGNPSSITWGNSPAAPLWREESGPVFSGSTTSGFSISKQQHVQKEDEEKDRAGMVTGEVKASSKARRHVTRTQLCRNANSNPSPNPSPTSAFGFGFPRQPPPGRASSAVAGFGPPRVPTAVASGGSIVAFASSSSFTPGTSGTGADASGWRPGAMASAQDERMEDIEEVTPAMARLTLNDHPSNSKCYAKANERISSSAVVQDVSWATGSDVSEKFSNLGLNASLEPSMHGKEAPGVFVFGAKSGGKEAAAASTPSLFQAPPARPRPLKVKRSVSAAKGKGPAAGNAAFGAPSPEGSHAEGSQSISGGYSSSQPTPGLGIFPCGDAECTSNNSSSSLGFVSSSSFAMPVQEDAVMEGLHQSSSRVQSPSRSGHHTFVLSGIAKGTASFGVWNARSESSNVAEALLEASTMKSDLSLSSALSRVPNRNGSKDESLSSSTKASFAGSSDNASDQFDVEGPVHYVSSELAFKLGLRSVGVHSDKDATAGSSDAGKSGKPFSTETAGSSQNETLVSTNLVSREVRTSVGRHDDRGLKPSATSTTITVETLRVAKETSIDAQKPSCSSFAQIDSELAASHAHLEPFVFGASRPQPTSTKLEAVSPSAPFKLPAKANPWSPSPRYGAGGGSVSRSACISVSDLLSFKHKGSATYDSATSRAGTDVLTSSLSSFNLSAAKPSVEANGADKSEGVLPAMKKPTTAVPSFRGGAILKGDSDESSSYVTAASRFVFSAGSASSSQSTAAVTPTAKEPLGAAGAEAKPKENIFSDDNAVTSDFLEARSRSQPSSASSQSFEFRANGEVGGSGSSKKTARKTTHRRPVSAPRRQSRSTLTTEEKINSGCFIIFADITGTADEAGSPMDFSPQRYTPRDDPIHGMEQTSKQAAWSNIPSMEKYRLDGVDEWAQYSETDVAMENLRNAANDLTIGSKRGGRATLEGIGKGEDDTFWLGGKENTPGKAAGRNGTWKRAVHDESHVPLSGRDNTWADSKVATAKEPESPASSSTPNVDSSTSSSSWGQFTFTAGSSSNLSTTTSFPRRHARRIQREKPAPGSTEALKTPSSKARGESNSSALAGGKQAGGHAASSAGSPTTTKHPVFSFDTEGSNPPLEPVRGLNERGSYWDHLKVPNVILTSRSNSWSTKSSSSLGSLPTADGVEPLSFPTAGAVATEQVCERWRIRGNQAYAIGDFPRAEEYYSRGACSVPPNETSQSCIRASMLCYSNRAATRMVVGRMREALADCLWAMAVDPNFLRVSLRAASCHLALGETDAAALAFKECIQRAKEEAQPDAKISSEASEGMRKSLQVDEYLDRASEILANWSSGDTPTALRLLNEALLSSPHSERALELKSRALLLLRRYDEVVQLCEQSLVTAERNHPLASSDSTIFQLLEATNGGDVTKHSGAASPLKMWRWRVTAKAKFHLGRLEEALEILQKLEELPLVVRPEKASSPGTSSIADPLALSIASIRDLLRHKGAGNDAFQNGKHAEAVEHYSAALACNGDSRPFSAVCFCNRAAASQALGNIGDAIADCSRAIALDPKYAKAISRRVTLHEKVRDYSQSCHDLQRLITLLEGQQQPARTTVSPARVGRSTANTQQDFWQARDRLAKAEDEMKKGHPLDHYMILGLEPGCSSNEIKKAYRKAALRHHPDKAGQFLARSEGGDDGGMWKEVADEVRHDAERLFKLIGEANAILSDTQKRTRYDAEEEFRKLRTRTGASSGGLCEMYRSSEKGQGGAGRRPRDRWDSWNGYGHQHQRWQSGPDAAQPDTYARRGRYGSNNSSRSNGDDSRWNDYDWDDM